MVQRTRLRSVKDSVPLVLQRDCSTLFNSKARLSIQVRPPTFWPTEPASPQKPKPTTMDGSPKQQAGPGRQVARACHAPRIHLHLPAAAAAAAAALPAAAAAAAPPPANVARNHQPTCPHVGFVPFHLDNTARTHQQSGGTMLRFHTSKRKMDPHREHVMFQPITLTYGSYTGAMPTYYGHRPGP
jgi:hypothetical protein